MKIFDNLSARERFLVFSLLPVLVLVVGYQFVWVPINGARSAAEDRIRVYRTVVEATRSFNSLQAGGLQAAAKAQPDRGPIATRVTSSAEDAGLSLRRLEPEGDRLRVSLEDSEFNGVVAWISRLEADEGLILVSAEIERRIEPGVVSARLLLQEAK